MPYCYRCGVKLEDDALSCPLCGAVVPEDSVPSGRCWPVDDAGERSNYARQPGAARILARQILLVVFMTPVLALLSIRAIAPDTAGWLGYVLVSLVGIWALSTIPLVAWRNPATIVVGEIVTTIGVMAGLDLLGGELTWSFEIGVPIVVLVSVVSTLVTLWIVRLRERGANVASIILAAIAVICVGLDVIVSSYVHGTPAPGWSMVVVAALSPVAAFLAYYHRSLRVRVPLGRRFHA